MKMQPRHQLMVGLAPQADCRWRRPLQLWEAAGRRLVHRPQVVWDCWMQQDAVVRVHQNPQAFQQPGWCRAARPAAVPFGGAAAAGACGPGSGPAATHTHILKNQRHQHIQHCLQLSFHQPASGSDEEGIGDTPPGWQRWWWQRCTGGRSSGRLWWRCRPPRAAPPA